MLSNRIMTILLLLGFSCCFTAMASAEQRPTISLNKQEQKQIEQGVIVVRELENGKRKGRTLEAVALIQAPVGALVEIITDYAAYPDFMPNIGQIDIHEQVGDTAIVDFILDLPMGFTKKYRLFLTVSSITGNSARVEWHNVEWPDLDPSETILETNGYWLITPKTKTSSLVLYHVYTDPGSIPYGLGWITDLLSEDSVPETVSQTRARAEGSTD